MDLQNLNVPAPRKALHHFFKIAAFLAAAAMLCIIWAGFPIEIGGRALKLKNLKPLFGAFTFCMLAAAWFSHAKGIEGLRALKKSVEAWSSKPDALWALFITAAVLFTWQQVTEYFSLAINFIPFGFFDYMLYYFFKGKIHFTGQLHTFYHTNNILFLFAPFWYFLRTPWLLIAPYGLIAAAAIFPLASIARKRFDNPAVPFWICFIYLNYRYLQNVLQMNFCVEIFYPLFIFAAVTMALSGRWKLYFLFVVLGLSVKEDAFLYFSGVAMIAFFMGPHKSGRIPAVVTVVISVAAFLFLTRIVMPWTGSHLMLEGNYQNFGNHVKSFGDLVREFTSHPMKVVQIFFGDPVKFKTYMDLTSRLVFLPLFTPAALLVFIPIFPLFAHATGSDADFWGLRFHYAAAVIPFVFLALVFGFSNACRRVSPQYREKFTWAALLLMVILNGGHFRTERFTAEDIKSIRWARELPAEANVVSHGHLLPYMGYREYNYYFADPWELSYHPAHGKYKNADYYLVDKNVNPYPWDSGRIEQLLSELKNNPDYETVLSDGIRTLFKRKSDHADRKNDG